MKIFAKQVNKNVRNHCLNLTKTTEIIEIFGHFWKFWKLASIPLSYTRLGQIYTFQKCIQNCPSTLSKINHFLCFDRLCIWQTLRKWPPIIGSFGSNENKDYFRQGFWTLFSVRFLVVLVRLSRKFWSLEALFIFGPVWTVKIFGLLTFAKYQKFLANTVPYSRKVPKSVTYYLNGLLFSAPC